MYDSPTLPGADAGAGPDIEVVFNWGLGLDSTACLTRLLEGPDSVRIDPARMAVIHMSTGSEWPDTLADAEHHVLPLLRQHGVRLVQLARAGQSDTAGIHVLDDSRSPQRLHARGAWTLWDELEINGTVPQQAGKRLCSIRAKGNVGDRWIIRTLAGRAFTQIIGFNADEPGRAARDGMASRIPGRTGRFPLLEWGWGRQRCEAFLLDRFGVRWKKSYCWFCCYPVSMGAMEAHLERMRRFPDLAGRVLRLEYTAMALNPRARLFGTRSLLDQFAPDEPASRPVLDAFENELNCPWGVFHVRRILPVSAAGTRAPALRSVRGLGLGSRARTGARLEQFSARHHLPVETDPYGSVRGWLRTRGEGFPAVEEFTVTAPAYVRDKQQDRFETEWARHTSPQPRLV